MGQKRATKVKAASPDRSKPVFAFPYLGEEERVAQVWELRLKGFSHTAIAAELLDRFGEELLPKGWSAKHVYEDCARALGHVQKEYRESAIEMIGIELERFDRLLAGIWDAAEAGDVKAVEAALSISRERRKLAGLDSPEKFQLDWRVEIVNLLQDGTVTPQQIATEFGNEVLVEVNRLLEDKNGV